MRLLLDECVPKRLRRELPGHEIRTVQEAGWAGVRNGALLRAADGTFDAMLTVDQGVEHQQHLTGLRIGVVIMVAASNDIDDLRPLVPAVLGALRTLQAGEIRRVGWLLRNCSFDLACREVDEPKSEVFCAVAEAADEARAILRVVGIGARVRVHKVVFQGAIDQDRQLAGGGGDGFGLADAEGHPSIERPERRLGPAKIHGTEAEDGRGAIRRGLCPTAQQTSAGDLVLRGEGQPGREVLVGGPARHVGADLRQQAERVVGPDAVDLRQVDAGELVHGRPHIEAGFVVARFLSAPRGGQRRRWRQRGGGKLGEVPFDRAIARGEVPLIDVKEVEILLQHKDVLGAIVPGQGGDDLGLGGVTPVVPMPGELVRVALASDDVAENPEARHPGDVADDQRELHVHLDQRFLHAWHERAGTLDERAPVAEIAAQGHDPIGGTEAPAQQPEDVQVTEPFAVGDITLATRKILHVTRVDENHLEPESVERLEDGNPVDAGGLHRHMRDTTRREPVCEAVQIAGERRKGLHRRGVTIRRHGHEVLRRSAVDAGGVGVEPLERGRGLPRLGRTTTGLALHGGLLYTDDTSENRDADERQSPKRDHAAETTCHQ